MKKLMIAAALAAFTLAAQAAKELVDGYTWEYTVSGTGAKIVNVEPSNGGELRIPSTIGGLPVVAVGGFGGKSFSRVVIPEGVAEILYDAFYSTSVSKVVVPYSVVYVADWGFNRVNIESWRVNPKLVLGGGCSCKGTIKEAIFTGEVPSCLLSSPATILTFSCRRVDAARLIAIWGYRNFLGYCDALPEVEIVSSSMRADDPTVMDVVYKVYSSKPQVKVRAIAYKDGVRSLANAIRPTKWIDGTEANVGDAIKTGVEHKLSWRIAGDWGTDLAKVKMEVLAVEDDILPLELQTIPQTSTHAKMKISWNKLTDTKVFDALLWLYAAGDAGLMLTNGQLKNGSTLLASGTSLYNTTSAVSYVFGKMGYQVLSGDDLTYARRVTQLDLPVSGVQQYAVKKY